MAAPKYATDLVDINLAGEGGVTTGWAIIGVGALSAETDFFVQGSYCISKVAWSGDAIRGLIYNYGSGVTLTSPECYFAWMYFWGPGALSTEAAGGMRMLIGSGATAYRSWFVRGTDTILPFDGWVCIPIDPSAFSADETAGSPTETRQYFGVSARIAAGKAIAKGNPLGVDALRYGRGTLRCYLGELGNPANFTGSEAVANSGSNRWGLFQAIAGGFLQQGIFLMGLGASSAKRSRASNVATIETATAHHLAVGDSVTISGMGGTGYNGTYAVASVVTSLRFTYANTGSNESEVADTSGLIEIPVYFVASNRNIVIANTKKVVADFNRFVVRSASSVVKWTNISITALGTVARGNFEAIHDADIDFDFCTFTDMGTFVFKSQSTILNTIFRRCRLVTQNSAIFTGCTFEATADSVKAVLSDNLTKITNSVFSGSGHAIELTPATPNEVNLSGVTLTGYGASETANAAIYNNSGHFVKINVIDDSTVPTIKNGSEASTQVVTNVRTYTFTVKDEAGGDIKNYEWRLYRNPSAGTYGTEINTGHTEGEHESATSPSQTYVYSYGWWGEGDLSVVLQVMHQGYVEYVLQDFLKDASKEVTITLKKEVNI